MILAGDVGGTHTRLAVFEVRGGAFVPVAAKTFPSHGHASLDEIAIAFVTGAGCRVEHACFGIAGPVRDGRSEATNLPWVVDAQVLAKELAIPTVTLVNDLEATPTASPPSGPPTSPC